MTLAEKLREEGERRGEIKGEIKALVKTATRLLMKRFGVIPEELKIEISKLDVLTLEILIGDIFEYKNLDDVRKYIK